MNNDTFDRFYNEFKNWSKEDILRRTYNIILDDADKTRQIEQLENIRKEAIECIETDSIEINTKEYGNLTVINSDDLLNILSKESDKK